MYVYKYMYIRTYNIRTCTIYQSNVSTCVCVYIYVYIYINIYICMYVYKYIYIRTYIIRKCSTYEFNVSTCSSRRTFTYLSLLWWMSHVTHMNELCHTREWVMDTSCTMWTYIHMSLSVDEWVTSHTWMRHATHMNESRHTPEWTTSHTRMSHVHTWTSHVTHMSKSRHKRQCVMSHIWIKHPRCRSTSAYRSLWMCVCSPVSLCWCAHP